MVAVVRTLEKCPKCRGNVLSTCHGKVCDHCGWMEYPAPFVQRSESRQCPTCETKMLPNGNQFVCPNCGDSTGGE